MLPPPINFKKNQCIVLIALVTDKQARSRYLKIREVLTPLKAREFESVGSAIMVTVTTNDLASLAKDLLSCLIRKDIVFIISAQDGQLVTQLVFHRAIDDDEIRETAAFWKPKWIE